MPQKSKAQPYGRQDRKAANSGNSSPKRRESAQTEEASLQERLAAIVESSDDAIISKDLGGIIQTWNSGAQRMFGYTAEETVGRHISMLAAPDRVDEIPAILQRLSRGERIDHYRTRRKTKDGRILDVSLTVSPIRDKSGKVIGASKIARDITHQVETEAALREANELLRLANADLEHFAYSASHDLQEPLRSVSIYSEMLRKRLPDPLGAGANECIEYIVEGAARMQQLLKDLRNVAQATTNTQKPTQDVDANEALRRSLAILKPAIEESRAVITHGILPMVRVHDFQLEQLFQNLIGNAIRYRSEAPPRIQVTAVRAGDHWQFSVQDNGIGIDPQYKEQIFGLFKRLHTAADYPGTGIGLAICQRIVHRAGGRIWVESEPGSGATFSFTLPAGEHG